MTRSRLNGSLPVFGALFVLAVTLAITNRQVLGLRPQQRKLIAGERVRKDKNDPVTITSIKQGGRNLLAEEEFDANDEWLRDVSFKLKNNSNKNITFVGVDMYFPDTQETGALMLRPLRFGRWPNRPNDLVAPLLLKPGETIDVAIASQYDSLKKFLESKQPINKIQKLMLRVYAVIFEDGTKWDMGTYYKPDLNTPSGYSRMESAARDH
jgi:hypothetical protein